MVAHNTEKAVAERLGASGHEAYVATQPAIRVWSNGRKARIDRVVISGLVFIRCTEAERRRLVTLPYIRRFMADRARANDGLAAPPAVIPDDQMATLRFMLGQSDHSVTLSQNHYRPGDKVRVIRGALRGLHGEVIPAAPAAPDPTRKKAARSVADQKKGTPTEVIVRLDILGTARVTIPATDLTPA